MNSPKISPVRISRRQEAIRQSAIDSEVSINVPDLTAWRVEEAKFDAKSRALLGNRKDESVLLESPSFVIPPNSTVYFSLFFEAINPSGLRLGLRSKFQQLAFRSVFGTNEMALSFRFSTKTGGRFNLVLSGYQPEDGVLVSVELGRLSVRAVSSLQNLDSQKTHLSYLPHWTKWQRRVHRVCSSSRWVNAAVATWEMHQGKEELLSLPQYMAICPTGQCNASCDFCSVTTNRTGIIKKQLPFEALDRFLSPVFGSSRLIGLEGNGEPTLYDRFDELIFLTTSRGASLYLISNGEKLTADQIALLLASPTDAINFSLNAATAETHRRVMKLKGWENVVQNISRLVRWRGDSGGPLVSVSMVVTRGNAHEVQQFLHFAEWQLKVDRILIRPLSEIANDSGVMEDLRDLVPYETQINDLLDAVEEYLEFVPRRSEIILDPNAFNAYRQEPRGVIFSVPGYENFLLAPRRSEWSASTDQVKVIWGLNRLEVTGGETSDKKRVWTRPIPVLSAREMTFRCRVNIAVGNFTVSILDVRGLTLAGSSVEQNNSSETLTINFVTPDHGGVVIELLGEREEMQAIVDFGHLYSSSALQTKEIKLPHSSRWQIDMPSTKATWDGNQLSLHAKELPGLYLYRSYTVPTLNDEAIKIQFKVEILEGELGIGILSDDGKVWLKSARFNENAPVAELIFNTGIFTGFKVVLYSLSNAVLKAKIDWGENIDSQPIHKIRKINLSQLLLPVASRWIVDTIGTDIQWTGNKVQINWDGPKGSYLLRSPRFPCHTLRNAKSTVQLNVLVESGELGIGFLGGENEIFTSLTNLSRGQHLLTIEIDTHGQKNLMACLYSNSNEPLSAIIDWGDCLILAAEGENIGWEGGLFDPKENSSIKSIVTKTQSPERKNTFQKEIQVKDKAAQIKAPNLTNRILNIYNKKGFTGVLEKTFLFMEKYSHFFNRLRGIFFNRLVKFRFKNKNLYCQKPWTDLNNFSVDGRMDVCCITTGPSQEHYALGNIFEQEFQQIWNGSKMKEFRRTVNSKDKLPPCSRCPMANNYHPPF
jgi:radical SAM protein with 4Fe4S-binding SPASM domain